jgi:hypothetical protein
MRYFLAILFSLLAIDSFSQFTISSNQRYLLKNGKPFFWLGDTGWELFHRLTKEEADRYLKRRAEQGFTVIQAVVLAEMDGLNTPNKYQQVPLLNNNPETPNEKYFELVDYIIDKADGYGINIALLPTWGDKVFRSTWGKGPEIFTVKNAAVYATWLANRYKTRKNIIWLLGGDREPRNEQDIAIWNAMGNAIQKVCDQKAMISFHPQPNEKGSAQWFHHESWLSFNMFQNGHCRGREVYNRIAAVYSLSPAKPVIDGEPIYEDHPVCFNLKDLGTSSAYDVRNFAYLDLFSGAFGHTYGCHDIWQMNAPGNEPVNGPNYYWYDALELPGANQMKYLRQLLESFPFTARIPDQTAVQENNLGYFERIQATRGDDYLLVYTMAGLPITVLGGKISGTVLKAYWFNPSGGAVTMINEHLPNETKIFTPPSKGYGKDWVLVMFDAAKNYSIGKKFDQ